MAFGDTIAATVLGKPTVPEDTDATANAVAEGAAVNTTVGITAHSTFANGNASLDYSLSADSSGGGFKIDQSTGVVTVADPSKIDFESAPGHLYTITVLATKNNNFSSEQTFTISVNDVAPSAPVDSNAAANTVLEGAANGTTVGVTASSTDVNGGAVTYSLIGDTSGGGFTVNATTGVVTVADGSKIDFESSPGHAYTVTVQSSDGTLTSSQAFTINVGDVAMTTPVDSNGAANSVAEGAAAGTTVGITAQASDPSGPAPTYSLIGDTSGGGFTINASTGVVTVANPAKIDFESSAPGHTYNITVQASNGVQTTSQVFSVGVTDVAPSAPTDSDGAANNVVEGAAVGTVVGVTASSSDVNGGAVTYSLIGDSSGGGFTINSTTGVITVANSSKIDYETAPGHAYTVTAQASDGTLTNSQTFTIGVSDVAPSAPTDSNPATNTVAEGAAVGTTVGITASSTDVNGPGVTYSLTGDTSGGGFTINSTTGVITVADSTKLDYETTPGHAYTVTAQASDGTLTNSQTFTIAVTDVAPSAPTDLDPATNTVAEGAANGSTVGITASSGDPNGPATAYSLTDSAGGRFAINSSTGVVTVANGAAIDFESVAGHAYNITVQALVGAISNSQTFSIGIADVAPSAPADTNPAADTVLEGAANGTAVGITASSTDPGGGPAAVFSLTDSAGGRFAIDSSTGIVTVANGAAIDFETATGHAYNITVQALAGALTSTHTFSIGVGNVNEAPAGTDKTVTTLEDTHYVFAVADFGFTDPSDSSAPNALQAVKITTLPGAGGTLTNHGNPVSAGNFISVADITGGFLHFVPAANANGSPEASFTFQVQDNGGTANGGVDTDPSANTITINVTPVNDAPTFNAGANQTVAEDAGPQTVAGFATAISPGPADESGQTVDFVVTGDTNPGLFAVGPAIAANGTLTYTPAANANGSATITVHAHDNGAAAPPSVNVSPDQSFTITVTPVNDAPGFTLAASDTVTEDFGARSVTGFASAISAGPADESGQTVNFVVTNNTNAALFAVGPAIAADGTLTYTPAANANGSATITVHAHDSGGTAGGGVDNSGDQTFVINVNAVNDAPTATGLTQSLTINEDDPATTLFTTAPVVSDIDSANVTATLTLDATQGVLHNAGTGVLASGVLTYTISGTKAAVNAALAAVTYDSAQDFNGSASVGVTIDDGANGPQGTNPTGTVSITVNPVNDAPVVTAGHTLNYTENQAATAIDTALVVSDIDSANLASATVQITGNYINGEDLLAFANTATITGSFNAATGTLTLTGSDTVANYQAALRAVTYFNTSDTPSGAARTVTIITNDGALNSAPATDTINVSAVNDAPVVTAAHTLNYTENQAATAIDPALTVSDVDSANLASATVQITGNYVNGEDLLAFANTATITGSFDAATGTLTLTGTDSVANYQAALRAVTYVNTSDNPSGAARTVTIIASDGAASSIAATDTINVAPVNDAPVVTAGHTLNYTENQAATAIDPAIIASDVDSPNLASATVQITGNYINGEDVLAFANTATITGSFDAATGTLTLTGSDSVANYQAALRAVTYVNTSDNPSGAARTVTIITNDGALNSAPATDTINVTPVNDAPVVTAAHTLNYTENQAATAIDPALAVSDADSANLASATVQITGNYVNGEDLLAFANTATITGSFDAATGTLTLTGSDSVANYQAALRAVTYVNTSDNPSGAARTVTIIASDGAASSIAATDTINVAPVNDAPVVVAGHTLNYAANQPATAIDPAITASDIDSANLASATVQITGGYVNGEDVLAFANTATITGTFDAATGTLTLTGSDSVANYQAALASVTYFNTSATPTGTGRTVTIIANDGAANSIAATDTISFDAAPTVTAGHTLNYTENQAATAFDPALSVTDTDSANLASATVHITGNYVNGEDVLAFANTATITGSFDAATGTLTLTGSDTVAHYQAALRAVTYVNTSDNPSGLARTVTITANDGILNSTPVTDTINVTPVNDAPVVTAGHTLNYTENDLATAIDPAIAVSDVDSANLASATVQITGNYANGQDVLAFANTATITGSFDALTGKLTLTGSDSVANYQAALRAVTYVNTSENPSGLARTVTIITNDGVANSVAKTDTINVTPVNDAPVTTAGGTLNYTENQVATVIDSSVSVTDADNANMATATVSIGTGFASGQDVLDANVTGTTIGKSYNAGTGVLTLTGSDTKAHYQQVLDSVTYFNSSNNPSGATRTINYTVNDGALNSNTSTATVNVTPVNDAPVVTIGATTAFTEPANGTPAANSSPVIIAPSLTISDVDSANLTQATFVLNNLKPSDALSISGHGGASGDIGGIHFAITSDATTETVTLTGTDTIAHYNSVLDLVQFNNTSENPDQTARSYTVTAVDDGTGTNTGSASTTETVTGVNDAPVNTVPVEQDAIFSRTATAITGLSVSDADSGAGETTALNVLHGTLNVATVGGGAAVTNNNTATVTLTGTAEQIATTLAATNGVLYTSGAYTGPDTLTLTTNDNGATGTGAHPNVVSTEALGVIPKVWFIDNTASAVGEDGSQAHPFHSIAAFNAINDGGAGHAQTGDYIYLKTGTGTYSETDGIHLLNGQQLIGGGDGLTFTDPLNNANTLTIETAGTRPVIDVTGGAGNDAIHLAQNNTIHGFNVATENAAAMGIADNGGTVGTLSISNMDVGVDPDGVGALSGNLGQAISIANGGTAGSMTFGTVNSGGGASGIALGGALATSFSATGGTLSGHSTSEVAISGGSATVSYAGTIGDGSGLSASVSGRTAGTVTLSGNINDGADAGGGITVSGNSGGTIDFTGATKTLNTTTGNAVALSSNTGATVDFTGGGLNIDTTSGTGFSATGGGTVSVTGPVGTTGNSITTTTGQALNLSGVTVGAGGVTFDSTTSGGGTNNVNLSSVTGTGAINLGTGSLSGASGVAFNVSGGTGNVDYNGSIAKTADGRVIDVQNHTTGTLSFDGTVSSTSASDGIHLSGNTSATIGFTNTLTLNTSASGTNAFDASGGGTVSATASGSTISSGAGTAVNISGTTIGGSGVKFQSVSANGAVNGIVLNGTGAGTFTVTGDGSQTAGLFDRDGSGGTIQSTTHDAVLLTNANAVLKQLNITNAGWDGVQATGSGNVTLSAVDINHPGNGSPAADGSTGNASGFGGGNGFYIENGTGTYSFDNNSRVINWQSSQSNAVLLHNTNTDFTSLTVDHALISTSATGAAGVNASLFGTTDGQVNITNSEFTLIDQNAAQILNNGSGTIRAIVQGNNFHDADATSGDGNNTLFLSNSANGALHFTIGGAGALGNTFHNLARLTTLAGVIQVDAAGGDASTPSGGIINGTITNNNIWNDSGFVNGRRAIDVQVEADSHNLGQLAVAITNNTVNNVQGNGIHVSVVSVGGGSVTDGNWMITGNSLGAAGTNNGIRVGLDNTDSSSAIEFKTNVDDVVNSNAVLVNKLLVSNNTGVNSANNATGATLDIANIGSSGPSGSATLNATITNNTLTNQDTSGSGHVLDVLNSSASTHETLNLNITGNNTTLGASTAGEIRLRELAGTFNIQGGIGSVSGNNNGDTVVTAGSFGTVASVALPTGPSFQLAAGGEGPGASDVLTPALLAPILAEAIQRWADAGATADQLTALAGVHVSIADLDGAALGQTIGGSTIIIDSNAAGWGWFVDPTPAQNSEFDQVHSSTEHAASSGEASGHMDLVTVVEHELGHVLGLQSTDLAGDLMSKTLDVGVRRVPSDLDIAGTQQVTIAKQAAEAEAALPPGAAAPDNTPVVAGTAGNDTINAGHGGNILVGGAGADNFVFGPATPLNAPTPAQVTHVADYHAAEGDSFDFSAITSAFHNSSVNDSLVVRAVEDASGKFATLQVDHIDPMGLPAAPNWVNVAQLDGAHAGDAVNVQIDNHSVHLAQIHVDLLV
jgi:hypothetical protein